MFVTQQEVDLLSKENKIIKVLAQCKNAPGPLTSVDELYSLGNKCTLHQALHTEMNLEIRFRTLTLITIKSVCALFQQKKMAVENIVRSLTSLISSQLWFSLAPKDPVKQLHDVPVPQAKLREPAISVRAAIIANIKLLKIDFLE